MASQAGPLKSKLLVHILGISVMEGFATKVDETRIIRTAIEIKTLGGLDRRLTCSGFDVDTHVTGIGEDDAKQFPSTPHGITRNS
jgi:hypothetical protein